MTRTEQAEKPVGVLVDEVAGLMDDQAASATSAADGDQGGTAENDTNVVAGEDEALVEGPAAAVVDLFELDPDTRVGGALAFAAVAALGLLLAVFATPVPVLIAGWLLVVFGAAMAVRSLSGDR